jgi:hypothetical protein
VPTEHELREFETDSVGLFPCAALRKICLTASQFETDQGQSKGRGNDRESDHPPPFELWSEFSAEFLNAFFQNVLHRRRAQNGAADFSRATAAKRRSSGRRSTFILGSLQVSTYCCALRESPSAPMPVASKNVPFEI